MSVNVYPKIYAVLSEYYQNNPKEINNVDAYDKTPLMYAISSTAMVKFLIDNGATVNFQNIYGITALHCSIRDNSLESGKLLCEYGANVHIKNRWNDTPIDSVIAYGGNKFIRLLLKYDSRTTKKNCNKIVNISAKKKYKKLVNNISLLNAKN